MKTRFVPYRKKAVTVPICIMLISTLICSALMTGCSGKTDSLNRVINSGKLIVGIAPDMEPFSFAMKESDPTDAYDDIFSITPDPLTSDSSAYSAIPSDTDETVSKTEVAAVQQTDNTVLEYIGLSVDLAGELSSMLNLETVFVPVEQERALEALENGEIDCYLCLAAVDIKTASAMNTIDMGIDYRQVFITSEKSGINMISELADHTLGCVRGSDTASALSKATLISSEVSRIIYFNSADALLKAVESGTVDAAVINEPLYKYRSRDKYSGLVTIKDVLCEDDMVIAMKLRDDTLSERIGLLYDIMSEDGTITRLREKWLGEENNGAAK